MTCRRRCCSGDAAGPDEVIALLDALPASAGVRPEIAKVAVTRLEKAASKPTRRMLKILAVLDERRLAPESGPLANVLAADRSVDAFIAGRPSHRITEENALPQHDRASSTGLRAPTRPWSGPVSADVLQAAWPVQAPELGGAVVRTLRNIPCRAS